jgi:hypothetical protein
MLRADSRRLIAVAQPAAFEQVLEFRFDRNMPQAYSFGATDGRHTTKIAF